MFTASTLIIMLGSIVRGASDVTSLVSTANVDVSARYEFGARNRSGGVVPGPGVSGFGELAKGDIMPGGSQDMEDVGVSLAVQVSSSPGSSLPNSFQRDSGRFAGLFARKTVAGIIPNTCCQSLPR